MATLAAAAVIGAKGYVGATAFLISAAAAVVDQALLFPALFPGPTAFGPRLGDYKLQYADEGSPATWCVGPECRIGCLVKWLSPLNETKDNETTGGKSGGGGDFVTYKYYESVCLEFTRRKITKLLKLWANGKLIYEEQAAIDYTNSQVTCTRVDTFQDKYDGTTVHHYYQDLSAPAATIDLSKFKSGKKVKVEGFANSGNNKTSVCVWAKENGDGSTTVRLDNQTCVNEALGPSVHLFQDNPQFSSKLVASVTPFYGTADQLPDPTIQGYEGDTNVPAWRGIAGVVLEDLALLDSGNVLPQFEALVETEPELTVGEAIAQMLVHAGYQGSEYDTSLCTAAFRGFSLVGPAEHGSALQPIQLAYDLIGRVRNGQIVFQPRTSVEQVTIDSGDLRADEPGAEHAPALDWTDPPSNKPPRVLAVKFQDPEKDYQTGTESEIAANAQSQRFDVVNLDVVMSAEEGRNAANRILWQMHGNRRTARLSLPPSYIGRVIAGTLLIVTDQGLTHHLLVERVDRGANYRLQIEAREEDQTLSAPGAPGETTLALSAAGGNTGSQHQNPTLTPGFAVLHVMDIPALDDDHLDRPGVYVAGRLTDERLRFTGALLYESADAGATWRQREHIAYEAVLGYVTTAPADVAEGCWDRGSTLTVRLWGGTLSSVSELACLNGANRALIGNEIIGFTDAVLVGENTYELRNLLRGLRGTGEFTGSHAAGERFTLLSGRGLYWIPLNVAAVNQARLYRLVPNGASVADASSESLAPTARNLRPWPVHDVRATRDGSNNITGTFKRRARSVTRILAPQAMPVTEFREEYEVDVMSGPTVLRTISASNQGFAYSAADQTTDGLTPGDPVDVNLYQISNVLRRGGVRAATV